MKKFTFLLSIILLVNAGSLFAQTDQETVNFTAILETVINLNIESGGDHTATFNTPDTYNFGIDAVGTTEITVESTSDWSLAASAPDFTDGGSAIIPINNLGVWLEATGVHTFGNECSTTFDVLGSSCGLTTNNQTLIDNANGNSGDATDNAFNLNWTMGTMNGTMNANSIFDQLADGTIANIGTFTTTVTLTVTGL